MGGHLADTGHALDGVLQRDGHKLLDLRGRQAQALGLDLDRDRRELGKHFDLLMAEGLHAEEHERRRSGDDQIAEAQARGDDEAHGLSCP